MSDTHLITQVTLDFADGRYTNRLSYPMILELQKHCGPVGALFARLLRGRYTKEGAEIYSLEQAAWSSEDLRQTIRCWLTGAKAVVDGAEVSIDPVRATQLVEAYVYPARPLVEAWNLATAILGAAVIGAPAAPEPEEVH